METIKRAWRLNQKLAATSNQNVPFVVPSEFENGPDNYGINAKAAVTITLAGDSGVKGYAVSTPKIWM